MTSLNMWNHFISACGCPRTEYVQLLIDQGVHEEFIRCKDLSPYARALECRRFENAELLRLCGLRDCAGLRWRAIAATQFLRTNATAFTCLSFAKEAYIAKLDLAGVFLRFPFMYDCTVLSPDEEKAAYQAMALLTRCGYDINTTSYENRTALDENLAVSTRLGKALEYFLHNGAVITRPFQLWSKYLRNTAVAMILISSGYIDVDDPVWNTPLTVCRWKKFAAFRANVSAQRQAKIDFQRRRSECLLAQGRGEQISDVCRGLAGLDLPALVLVEICDLALGRPAQQLFLHIKWDIVVKVKRAWQKRAAAV